MRLREEVEEAVGKERNRKVEFLQQQGKKSFCFLPLKVTGERSRRPTMAREWRILRQRRRASLPTLTNMSNMSTMSTLPLPTLTTLTTFQNMSNMNSDAHPIKMRGNQEEPRAKDELESSLLPHAQLSKSTKDKNNQDAIANDRSDPDCYAEQMKGKQKEMVRGEL